MTRSRIPTAFFYYVSFATIPIFSFVQTKILTSILSPQSFGEIQLLIPIIGWGIIIGGMGTPQFLIRFYLMRSSSIFHECLVVTVAASLLLGVIAYFIVMFFGPLPGFLNSSPYICFILFITIIIGIIFALAQATARAREEHLVYNLTAILERLCATSGIIVGVLLFFGAPLVGYLLGNLIGTGLILAVSLFFIFRKYGQLKNKLLPPGKTVQEILSYGVPIISVLILSDFLVNLNRYILAKWIGTAEVASYVVGVMISSIFFIVVYTPLLTFIHPLVFKAWENKNRKNVEDILNYYLDFYNSTAILLCGLIIRMEDILTCLVAGPLYRLPAGAFPILVSASFVVGIYRFTVTHYLLKKNTIELVICFIISVLVDVVSAIMFLKIWGVKGVAVGVFLGNLALLSMVWIRGRGMLTIRVISKKTLLLGLISSIMIVAPVCDFWKMGSGWRAMDAIITILVFIIIWVFTFRKTLSEIYSRLRYGI